MKGYRRQAKQLRALAHPVRLHLLEVLRQHPACVCELVALTRKRQPYVSQQLAILRQAGLVKWEKRGLMVRYRVAGPVVGQLIGDLLTMFGDLEREGSLSLPVESSVLWRVGRVASKRPLEEVPSDLAKRDPAGA